MWLSDIEKIVAEKMFMLRNSHKQGKKIARYGFLQKPEGVYEKGVWIPTPYEKMDCCMKVQQTSVNSYGTNVNNRYHCRRRIHVYNLIAVRGAYDVVMHFKIMHKFTKEVQDRIRDEQPTV